MFIEGEECLFMKDPFGGSNGGSNESLHMKLSFGYWLKM